MNLYMSSKCCLGKSLCCIYVQNFLCLYNSDQCAFMFLAMFSGMEVNKDWISREISFISTQNIVVYMVDDVIDIGNIVRIGIPERCISHRNLDRFQKRELIQDTTGHSDTGFLQSLGRVQTLGGGHKHTGVLFLQILKMSQKFYKSNNHCHLKINIFVLFFFAKYFHFAIFNYYNK